MPVTPGCLTEDSC